MVRRRAPRDAWTKLTDPVRLDVSCRPVHVCGVHVRRVSRTVITCTCVSSSESVTSWVKFLTVDEGDYAGTEAVH